MPAVMPRFGVKQKDSIRAIDDGRSGGHNRASRLVEPITTPSFFYAGLVARAYAAADASLSLECTLLVLVLLDLTSAYRTIPTSQPWYTVVAFYDPTASPPGVRYYWLPGHNFGLASAVLCRLALMPAQQRRSIQARRLLF